MTDTGDRSTRAGIYVLGLMSDNERERAERDLETDQAFREAVIEAAERMHMFEHGMAPEKPADDTWREVKRRIDGLPQMRNGARSAPPSTPGAPVSFGRRRSDTQRETILAPDRPKLARTGFKSAALRRAAVMAVCLMAAFALGYLAGKASMTATSGDQLVEP